MQKYKQNTSAGIGRLINNSKNSPECTLGLLYILGQKRNAAYKD